MKKKVLIAGQEGMVGSSVLRLLSKEKSYRILSCPRKKLDFTNITKVEKWIKNNKPEIVINCAGKVGGILDNSKYQHEYLYRNTMIGLNLANISFKYNVKKFINLGSACIYPKKTKQPIKEDFLLSSKLETTNEGYALAKILVLKYCEYIKLKFKKDFISLQPANLYGVGDNFDLKSSHVIPALVKKFFLAKKNNQNQVEIWGSGNVKREFLNVNDLAEAIKFCLEKKIKDSFLNIGSGEHISIKKLALTIKDIVGFNGKIFFNKKYPDGVKLRRLDSKKINHRGWKANIQLKNGLINYCKYFEKEIYKK
ncbi:NAD-dependent epimerase/dehydratase family protein [Candidatus Pelagibacter sp.]|nr:NAD-dependent epimerase/dehydratase family protein [Candidatus Pelagibacter sp.]